MKVTKKQLKQIIKEEIEEAAMDEGFMDSIKKAVHGSKLGAKAVDKIKGTGNLSQTVQAEKQITAMVQKLAKTAYGGESGARSLAQLLQKLAADIMKANPERSEY